MRNSTPRSSNNHRQWFLAVIVVFLIGGGTGWGSDCPPEGDGGDPELNKLKNRTDVPTTVEPMHWDALAELDMPDGIARHDRDKWPKDAREEVEAQEKRAVGVSGWVVAVKREGPESCNCHSDNTEDYDYHVWLGNTPEDEKADAVVVEVTPHIRKHHATWTRTKLLQLGSQHAKVRITGWIMFDQEHPEQLGKHRVTLWEIHPILGIETWTAGHWKEL